MKPPVCAVCHKRFDPSSGGGTVSFNDYKPLPHGMTGHPHGMEWFCEKHLEMATQNSQRPTTEAIAILQSTSFVGRLSSLIRKLWIRRGG